MTWTSSPRTPAAGLALGVAAFVFAPTAAQAGQAPPGNNGDIKIHSASTPQADQSNEPQPDCPFYISFFNFDPNDEVDFIINLGPPFPNNPAGPFEFQGQVTTDANGNARSVDISLPDGQYKAYAVEDGAVGQGAKQKVFTADCPAPTPTPVPTPTPDGGGPTPTPDVGGATPTPTPVIGAGGGNGGEVGGVQVPRDEDEGPAPVGGVDTGGGALNGVTSVDVGLPLAMTAAAGLALGVIPLRRRRAE